MESEIFSELHSRAQKAGKPPGTLTYTGTQDEVEHPEVTVTVYTKEDSKETTGRSFAACQSIINETATTWVNIEGLHDIEVVKQVADYFNLHPLTVEDILNVEQRPKIEEFDNYIFVTLKVILWQKKSAIFSIKQLSLVLGKNYILSFQELDTTLFDKIRTWLRGSAFKNVRKHGSDYLLYRLVDVVVDEYFVVLDALSDQIEKSEALIITNPTSLNVRSAYRLKRQMLILRKAIWPMRELLSHLMHSESKIISKFTLVYLRDVYDHAIQAIDTLEIFRDMLSGMLDMYLSSLTNRMNEIMKTLTIITTIFIPITSLASIYGMNFHYMPELSWRYGYPTVITAMFTIAAAMLVYFRLKKWL